MSETWTEYAVRFRGGLIIKADDRRDAERIMRDNGHRGVLLGRTVTASDWLPVDTDGAK